jgi:hypothetical protein
MALFKYTSDNTDYPDPTNIIEAIALWWHNLWDKKYQDSKKQWERLHRHEPDRRSKSEKAKDFVALRKDARKKFNK